MRILRIDLFKESFEILEEDKRDPFNYAIDKNLEEKTYSKNKNIILLIKGFLCGSNAFFTHKLIISSKCYDGSLRFIGVEGGCYALEFINVDVVEIHNKAKENIFIKIYEEKNDILVEFLDGKNISSKIYTSLYISKFLEFSSLICENPLGKSFSLGGCLGYSVKKYNNVCGILMESYYPYRRYKKNIDINDFFQDENYIDSLISFLKNKETYKVPEQTPIELKKDFYEYFHEKYLKNSKKDFGVDVYEISKRRFVEVYGKKYKVHNTLDFITYLPVDLKRVNLKAAFHAGFIKFLYDILGISNLIYGFFEEVKLIEISKSILKRSPLLIFKDFLKKYIEYFKLSIGLKESLRIKINEEEIDLEKCLT